MNFPPYYIDINKYDLDNFTFITGSSSNHFEESKDLIASIQSVFPQKSIYYYDLGLNNEEIEQVKSISLLAKSISLSICLTGCLSVGTTVGLSVSL